MIEKIKYIKPKKNRIKSSKEFLGISIIIDDHFWLLLTSFKFLSNLFLKKFLRL